MITESTVGTMPEMGVRAVSGGGGGGGDVFGGEDLSLFLREQRRQDSIERERELNIYRSGSAPPTIDGSLAAIGSLFGGMPNISGGGNGNNISGGGNGNNGFLLEEEITADPDYVSYYYSNVNLNPRLPPPVLSKEDWRFTQRMQAGSSGLGGIGDRRKLNRGIGGGVDEGGDRSLFSMQPGFGLQNESEVERRRAPGSREWFDRGEDGLIGLPTPGRELGRQRSFADIFQDDYNRLAPIGHPSRPASRNTFDDGVEPLGCAEDQLALHHQVAPTSHTFASVLTSSLSRSTTPDPQLGTRAPSPCLPPVGSRLDAADKNHNNGSRSFKDVSSRKGESDDLLAALSGMSLTNAAAVDNENIQMSTLQHGLDDRQSAFFDLHASQSHIKQRPHLTKSGPGQLGLFSNPQQGTFSYPDSANRAGNLVDMRSSASRVDGQDELHMPTIPSASSYLRGPSSPLISSPGGSVHYQNSVDGVNASFLSYGLEGYSPTMMAANLPPLFENAAAASAMASLGFDSRTTELQNIDRIGNLKAASALQMPLDPVYIQYLKTAGYPAQVSPNFGDPSADRGYMGNPYADLLGIQKSNFGALLQTQDQYGMQFPGKPGTYYGNPAFSLGGTYQGRSPRFPGSPLMQGERNMRFHSGLRNSTGGIMGSWHLNPTGSMEEGFPSSLLEEFKGNKTRCFELSEIASHVVEFSADQYGSRFIQQKLETATTEEKNMVYEEIMPRALSLMTDVFGNYVVQKFFEHGSAAQIRELANQLNGHVLTLSLQMYGCRVIQKAIEVVDLDQQIRMVTELDGHVMRCVRDQNGNHVIQKCIECVPQDAIQFIITTFYDQVVTLSTHPYGCRVIQRVLEHCDDPKTQQIVMDEIMQCICMLAQDQYGNYVVQHVLEYGKPHERSAIIKMLAGQIVQMSQQKFASNVVEKCLTFGGPVERQILVNEMLGSTDENEPLQAMMKDQFANYVVQKVLETCDDQQRELILSRIKVHLTALKKYTYGKHIVARVEKLVAAGERRIGLQSGYPS